MVRKLSSPNEEVAESLLRKLPRHALPKLDIEQEMLDCALLSPPSLPLPPSPISVAAQPSLTPSRSNSYPSRKYVDFIKNNSTPMYADSGGICNSNRNMEIWPSQASTRYVGISSPTADGKLFKATWTRKKEGKKTISKEKNSDTKSGKYYEQQQGGAERSLLVACGPKSAKPALPTSPFAGVSGSIESIKIKDDFRVNLKERMLKDTLRSDLSVIKERHKLRSRSSYSRLSPKPHKDIRKHLGRFVPRTGSKRNDKKKESNVCAVNVSPEEQSNLNTTTTLLKDCDLSDEMDFSTRLVTSPMTTESPRLISREELFSSFQRRMPIDDLVHVDFTAADLEARLSSERDRTRSISSSLRVSIPLVKHSSVPKEGSRERESTSSLSRGRSFSRSFSTTTPHHKYLNRPASPSLRERTLFPLASAFPPPSPKVPSPSQRIAGTLQLLRCRSGGGDHSDSRKPAKFAASSMAQQQQQHERDHPSSGPTPGSTTSSSSPHEIRRFFSFGCKTGGAQLNNNENDDKDHDGSPKSHHPSPSVSETVGSSLDSLSIRPLEMSLDSPAGGRHGHLLSSSQGLEEACGAVPEAASSVSSANSTHEGATTVDDAEDLLRSPEWRQMTTVRTTASTTLVVTEVGIKKSNRIRLHVYDLIAPETVVPLPWGGNFPLGRCFNAVNSSLHSLGTGAYHCGVEVNGVEYAYGANDSEATTGVFTCEPMRSPGYQFRTTIDFGERPLIRQIVVPGDPLHAIDWHVGGREVLREMAGQYLGKDYDLLRKNCCTFAHDACVRLGVTENEIPSWFRNLCQAGALAHDAALSTMKPISKALDGAWCGNEQMITLENGVADSHSNTCVAGFLDVSKLRLSLDSGVRTQLDDMASNALNDYTQPALQN